jgi:hypothetical protein
MRGYVGMVRTSKRLERAMNQLVLLKEETLNTAANFASPAICWSYAIW